MSRGNGMEKGKFIRITEIVHDQNSSIVMPIVKRKVNKYAFITLI